jgi:hypothetical protein
MAVRAPLVAAACAMLVLTAAPADAAPIRAIVSYVVPVRYVSQLAEPAPADWRAGATPYCAAAASLTVMQSFGVEPPERPLATTFAIGRSGNTTSDPGIDPDGISHLMRHFGGEGRIHVHVERGAWLHDLIARLDQRAPVVALTQAGNHAVTVYGYQKVEGGAVTALYVADPLSGHVGLVGIDSWLSTHRWMGTPFAAPGEAWRGKFVFVTYRDARSSELASAGPGTGAILPAARAYRSGWVAQSAYPRIARGAFATLTMHIRNVGTSAWVRGTPTEARLGIVGDDPIWASLGIAYGWPLGNRPAVQAEANVAPSEIATFTFRVRGAMAGVWQIRLRPVIDGVTWLDDQGIYTIVTID